MCVFLYMHPSSYFLPQPASQQDSDQRYVDDNGAGENNGGPGKGHWHCVIMARQQFHADRVNADFCHKDDSLREDRASRMAHTESKEKNSQRAQDNQRQGDGCVPAVAGMEPGDDAEVHGDAQTVQKQRNPEDDSGRKENRQAENPQDDADADDIEGPVGKGNKQKVQKSADNRRCGQTDGHEKGGFLTDAGVHIALIHWIRFR